MNDASLSGDEGCTHTSAYRKRQQKSVSAWLGVRDQMLRAIECSVPSSNAKCLKCEEKLAVIICLDCGPQACYCEECVESAHSKENITPQTPDLEGIVILLYLKQWQCNNKFTIGRNATSI